MQAAGLGKAPSPKMCDWMKMPMGDVVEISADKMSLYRRAIRGAMCTKPFVVPRVGVFAPRPLWFEFRTKELVCALPLEEEETFMHRWQVMNLDVDSLKQG